jgi:hypothetical protein
MRRVLLGVCVCLACGAAACGLSELGESGGPDDAGGAADGPSRADAAELLDASGVHDVTGPDSPHIPDVTSSKEASAADVGDADDGDADGGVNYGDASVETAEVSFYGWDDNTPPGNMIAYPKGCYPTQHDSAGGTGTYADPVTMATSPSEIGIGSFVYVPFLKRYVVMEDYSMQCDTEWETTGTWHILVWMNSNGTETASALTACETKWAEAAATIVIDPPDGLEVDTTPLFDPSTNTCLSSL